MSKDNVLVSVIIPTYKRPDTLSRAIESVLQQTYSNIEIIVIDDNDPHWTSRVQTEKTMRKYDDFQNVKYIKHLENKNGSAARNTGIKNSQGKYLMFLDDDDEFIKDKVEFQLDRMEKLDHHWGACYTNYVRKKNNVVIVKGKEKKEGYLLKEELMRNLFIHAGSNLMVRRNVVEEINGFDESFSRNQDIEFLTRILVKYKIAYVDKVGLVVHVHNNKQAKMNFEDTTRDYLNKFSYYIEKLSSEEKTDFDKMIKLQLFRNFVTTPKKKKKALQMIVKKDISLYLVLKYFSHLLKRKVTKKAYGFDLN